MKGECNIYYLIFLSSSTMHLSCYFYPKHIHNRELRAF